ncbi:HRDC domain-containing protein [bacterium]|nr:HRDC domain-containing protein [candidate division CSSED10-310 bacterium]
MVETAQLDKRMIIPVQSSDSLEKLLEALQDSSEIALDMEADSLHHYRDRVCLIQISTDREDWIIDPICISNLDPLWHAINTTGFRKVLHGADFDLRSLDRDFSVRLTNIFDTKIALELLGSRQIGLAGIIKERFEISLSKKFQKYNWSRRPLSKDALIYAASDTRFLLPLKDMLYNELLQNQRWDWACQEFTHLETTRWQPSKKERLGFWRFIRHENGDPNYLQAVYQLFAFRERMAERCDLPVFRIFKDEKLTELAGYAAKRTEPPKSILKDISPAYRKEIIDIVLSAVRIPVGDLPEYPAEFRETEPDYNVNLFRQLQISRDRAATRHRIAPSVIAGNKLLKKMAALNLDQIKDFKLLKHYLDIRVWQWTLVLDNLNV